MARARSAIGPPPSSLTASAPASLTKRWAVRDRLLVGRLVGAERQVADHQRRAQAAADGLGEHQQLVERDRHRVAVAEDVVGGGVADQHDVDARVLDDQGARMVVGGDHDDRLAEGALLGELEQGDGLALRAAEPGVTGWGGHVTAPFGSTPRRSGVAALSMRTLSIRRVSPMQAATTIEWTGLLEGVGVDHGEVLGRDAVLGQDGAPRVEGRSRRGDGAQRGAQAAAARRRSSGLRRTLRLDIARPSGSRTVGRTSIRAGSRGRGPCRLRTATCWASFWPK